MNKAQKDIKDRNNINVHFLKDDNYVSSINKFDKEFEIISVGSLVTKNTDNCGIPAELVGQRVI